MESTQLAQNIICNKEDVTLIKLKDNTYRILLQSHNSNVNLKNIINFDIYKLMVEINKKHMDSCELIKMESHDTAYFLYKFKALGANLGIPKKYMYVKTQCVQTANNIIEYKSTDLAPSKDILARVKGYDKITCNYSNLNIELFNNNNSVKVDYYFNINIHENLPIFAQNILGILMKKMLLNLKIFIEKI